MSTYCSICKNTSDIYFSGCKCIELCIHCAKAMAKRRGMCPVCKTAVNHIIKETPLCAIASSSRTREIPDSEHGKKVSIETTATGKKNFMHFRFDPDKDDWKEIEEHVPKTESRVTELHNNRAAKRLKIGSVKRNRAIKSTSSDDDESKCHNGWDYEEVFSDDDVDMSGSH